MRFRLGLIRAITEEEPKKRFLSYVQAHPLLLVLLLFQCCSYSPHNLGAVKKISGMSLESPAEPVTHESFVSLNAIHANYVAIIPYAYSENGNPQVSFDLEWQWWGERVAGTKALIHMAHNNGLQVMLKPHVWVQPDWVGEYDLTNDSLWSIWEQEYSDYILEYALIAQELKVELFCIGTEYRLAAIQRPAFWRDLITRIRKIYFGQLTYSANWDEFNEIAFWNSLDFIGVNAYFPLSTDHTPSIQVLDKAWEKWIGKLEKCASVEGKQILFTEFGYRSIDGCAGSQWSLSGFSNNQAQSNAYEAFLNNFWKQEWVAGGFAWKWHMLDRNEKIPDDGYTPQGKPSLQTISTFYKQKSF